MRMPFGQARLKFLDLVLDALGDLQRVLAVPHHHDGADRLAAVLFQHAAAELAAAADRAELRHADGRALFAIGLDDDLLDVADALDPAHAADDELGVALLDHLAADRRVGPGDGGKEFAEGHVVGTELVGIDVDLVLDRAFRRPRRPGPRRAPN